MTQRISILRIVGAIAAVTLITGAVTSVIECHPADRKFWEWVNARPMNPCGCENLAFVNALLAFVLGIPGLIIGVIVTIGFVKHGWKTPPECKPSRWLRG